MEKDKVNVAKNFSSINLLPQEIILQRRQSTKLLLVNKLSVLLLILLVFGTSATFTLRISQNIELDRAEQQVALAEKKVNNLQGVEGQLIILKDRLNKIQSLSGSDNKRRGMFNTIAYLTPPGIQVSDLSVDRNSNVSLTLISPSLAPLEVFFSDLSNREKNGDMIKQVSMESLAVGKDAAFRVSLKVTAK